METLTDRLDRCYTGVVWDAMREMALLHCVLPRSIRPVDPGMRMAGPVFTVTGRPDATLSVNDSLLLWTEFLGAVPPGHVVICQPHDDSRALMGELSAETLQVRGVRGYIVEGGCRDIDFIRRIGFPVFASFASPRDIVAAWRPESLGQPIKLGEVEVETGDYVLADVDGAVVIPGAVAETVVARVEELMQTESQLRKAILGGMDPKAAYLQYGKF
jgi:4-hydroxy-4-methyl-2-oxoglutarate aldolase